MRPCLDKGDLLETFLTAQQSKFHPDTAARSCESVKKSAVGPRQAAGVGGSAGIPPVSPTSMAQEQETNQGDSVRCVPSDQVRSTPSGKKDDGMDVSRLDSNCSTRTGGSSNYPTPRRIRSISKRAG